MKMIPNFQGLDCPIKQWGKGTLKELYATVLEKLPERWKRCVDLKGEHIERFDDDLYRNLYFLSIVQKTLIIYLTILVDQSEYRLLLLPPSSTLG